MRSEFSRVLARRVSTVALAILAACAGDPTGVKDTINPQDALFAVAQSLTAVRLSWPRNPDPAVVQYVVERREGFLSANSVSKGSERWVDVHTYKSAQVAIEKLRGEGRELLATHPTGELSPEDLAAIPKLALVLGNERDGITGDLASACTRAVRIPMRGFAESLNVSVTAAILLSHATARRP